MEQRYLHLLGATGQSRMQMYEGREHLVVPVVALMEGVIHAVNSSVPEFVPAASISSAPYGWNGRPLVLGHPTKNGVQISANDARVLETQSFGTIFNTRVEGKKLLMDAYIDPVKAKKIGGDDMLDMLRNNKMCEVSVGAFVTTDNLPGSHNGKPFKASWQKIDPDHLAFLPKGRGACSIEMGCGAMRVAHMVTAEEFRAMDWASWDAEQSGHSAAAANHTAAAAAHGAAAAAPSASASLAAQNASHAAQTATTAALAAANKASATANAKAKTPGANKASAKINAMIAAKSRVAAKVGAKASKPPIHIAAKSLHAKAAAAHERMATTTTPTAVIPGATVGSAVDNATTRHAEGIGEFIIDPETLRALRDIPQSARDKMDDSDFGGPDQSFPIQTQADVDAAKRLIGKAANPDAVKAKIISIAKRKGLTIPEAWQPKAASMKFQPGAKVTINKPGHAAHGKSGEIKKSMRGGLVHKVASADGTPIGTFHQASLKAAAAGDTPSQAASEEAAELIGYHTIKILLDQVGALHDEASSIVDELISDEEDDPTDTSYDEDAEEEVEQARCEAIQTLCMSMSSSLGAVMSQTYKLLMPDLPEPSDARYAEAFRAAIGARNSAGDQSTIQAAHDMTHQMHGHTVALGADCNGMKLLGEHAVVVTFDGKEIDQAHLPMLVTAAEKPCGCGDPAAKGELTMTKEQRSATIKALTENPASGYTVADVKFLDAASDERLEAIEVLANGGLRAAATKAESEKIIVDKATADGALAQHAKMLADDAAKKAAKTAGDSGNDDQNVTSKQGGKVKAAEELKAEKLKAAAAAGKTLEQFEEDEYLASAPESLRTLIADKKAEDAARKTVLKAAIKTAAAGVFTDEQLDAKSITDLEQLMALAKIDKPDYSGKAMPRVASDGKNTYAPPDPYAEAIKTLQARNSAN